MASGTLVAGSDAASSSSTLTFRSSLSRLATTPPPEPEPTTITSYRPLIPGATLRRQNDLRGLAGIEYPVGLFAFLELHAMADDAVRFQPARDDEVYEGTHVGRTVAPA